MEFSRNNETRYYLGIDKSGWIIFFVTLFVAAGLMQFGLVKHIVAYLNILIHEFGHFLSRMLFGYPSIPAFDFREGGGVTSYTTRAMWIMLLPLGGLIYVLYLVRTHIVSVVIVVTTIVLFILLAFTNGHNYLCIWAGHGMEILIGGLFLYRAMSGSAVINPMERPVYASCGWGMLIHAATFFIKLLTDDVEMIQYRMGKSYVENDLVKIESMCRGLSVKLQCVLFILFCLAMPLLAFSVNFLFKWVRDRDRESLDS